MKSERVFGLDVMRAAAILLVVVSHMSWLLPEQGKLLSVALGLSGILGVEVFFVLSGFLIGRIIYNLFVVENFSFKTISYFWVRRWFRTLPNYYFVLFLNCVVVLFFEQELPNTLWHYVFFIQNFAWEMPSFFSVSWSLPIEELAYIIGPLLLYLILFLKLKVPKSKQFLGITVLILVFFLITKMSYNTSHGNSNLSFWNTNLKAITIYRIDAIYYGVLAAYFSKVFAKSWIRFKTTFFSLGVLLFVVLQAMIYSQGLVIEMCPLLWNVLYLPIVSVAIALCLPLLSEIKTAPKYLLKPITTISVISYSIYLLHYSMIMRLMKHFMPTHNLSTLQLSIYSLSYLFITFVFSYILYHAFEKPLTKLRDNPIIVKRFLD